MIKKTAILALALLLVCGALFSCAQQPEPIVGEENIRAVIAASIPETDHYAILMTPVWGEDVQGETRILRVDGNNYRETVATPAGNTAILTLVGTDFYLYVKTPATEEGGTAIEKRLHASLTPEEVKEVAYYDNVLSDLSEMLAEVILSGDVRAYRLPDGKYQIISENADNHLLTSMTDCSFSSEENSELLFVTDAKGRLAYVRITGTAMNPETFEDTPLFYEIALSFDALTLTPPEDAAIYEESSFPFSPFGE